MIFFSHDPALSGSVLRSGAMLESRLMRLIRARAWALLVVSALLQVAIFPIAGPLPSWRAALAWVALIPFLLALLGVDSSGKPVRLRYVVLMGYLCGILWYAGNDYWVEETMHLYGGLPQPVAFGILILFALYLGLYHAFFAALVGWMRTSRLGLRGTLLLAPFLWVAVELARARITFFPWDLLGYSQVENQLITALAPIGGVMAISFAIVAVNSALTLLVVSATGRRKKIGAFAFIFIAIALSHITGRGLTHIMPGGGTPQVAVMMQENIEVGAVGKAAQQLTTQQALSQFSAWSKRPEGFDSSNGSGPFWNDIQMTTPATVILWPEAPSRLLSSDPYFRAALGQLARGTEAPAIIGSLGVDRSSIPARGYYLYDSASIFSKQGDYIGRYDKIHLVPWGEYIPFKQFFSFADKLTEGVGDMDRGYRRSVFMLEGHAYGVFVCYESIFGDEIRQFVKNGAEVLVNISDDGWYGDSGAPWQHLNMARMRAIENHRWVLRDTNTGVTAAIDPDGRMAAQAPRHVRGAYAFPFAFTPATDQTFYTRHGDWFAWICAAVTTIAIILTNPYYVLFPGKQPSAEMN